MALCVFHAGRRVIVRLVAPFWMSRFRLCCRVEGREDTGWFHYDFTSCGGGASSSGNAPGPRGGAERIAAPRGKWIWKLRIRPSCPLWSLSRFPHRFRWCWSRRPRLGALNVRGAHMWIRIYDCWLEWRSWPV